MIQNKFHGKLKNLIKVVIQHTILLIQMKIVQLELTYLICNINNFSHKSGKSSYNHQNIIYNDVKTLRFIEDKNSNLRNPLYY